MILEGEQSVIDAIKEKKQLSEANKPHDHIRPLLIIDGGLMKGMYGVGAVLAMEELGYKDVFESLAGVSSGAVTLAYFLAGNIDEGYRIATVDSCNTKFINFKRFWNILDPRVFEKFLRGHTGNKLECENILESDRHFSIGLSEHKTGTPMLLQPQTCDEVYSALRATVSMPGSTRIKTLIRGTQYSDGASTYPLAVEKMIYDIEATHILFITNQDKHTLKIPFLENFINNTLFRHRMPRPLRVAASMRWETRHALVQRVSEEQPKPILFVWGDGSISSFERDPKIIEEVVEKSRQWWNTLLGGV